MRHHVLTTLRLAGGLAFIAFALSGANCGTADDVVRVAPDATPIAPVNAPRTRPPAIKIAPGTTGSLPQTADDPVDLLERMVGTYRTWTCRLIDFGNAIQDGDVTKQEIAKQAMQEVAGAVPVLRRRQAGIAVDKLIDGDPSALKDLVCF